MVSVERCGRSEEAVGSVVGARGGSERDSCLKGGNFKASFSRLFKFYKNTYYTPDFFAAN